MKYHFGAEVKYFCNVSSKLPEMSKRPLNVCLVVSSKQLYNIQLCFEWELFYFIQHL